MLKDMIFPNCEKLGQTIIFVRTKETSRQLHGMMQNIGYKITSIQAGAVAAACMLLQLCCLQPHIPSSSAQGAALLSLCALQVRQVLF